MAATGMADDADYFASIHVGVDMPTGEIACGVTGLICTTKMDATFEGVSAHAGGSPDLGKNALLAACNAAINLHAITRHSRGATRVNVGVLQAGVGRNVIAPNAFMKFEVRRSTPEINEFMVDRAMKVVRDAAGIVPAVTSVRDTVSMTGGGEDCTFFMERVQKNGGICPLELSAPWRETQILMTGEDHEQL